MDDGLISLIRQVNGLVDELTEKKLRAFVVLLGDNGKDNKERLAKIAKDEGIVIPLTISVDGQNGPRRYKLDPKTPTTVLIYGQGTRVKQAFALDGVDDADSERVIEAARKIAG